MATIATTIIDGITVELDEADDNAVMGSASIKKGKREYFGSLALLEGMHVLNDHEGNETEVKEETIDRIMAWAENHGY
jgi:hypothetical protein